MISAWLLLVKQCAITYHIGDREEAGLSTIGQRLRNARDRQLLMQEELAERAGVPVLTISRIENDRYTERPRQTTIRKLALALGVDPVWLAFGDDEGKAAA